MRAGLIMVTVGLAIAVSLSGCSDKKDGTALPATTTATENTETTQPTSSSNGGGGGAPKIDSPLNATKFLTQPCSVLSAAQLKSFNISRPGKPDINANAVSGCIWFNDDEPVSRSFDMSFLIANKNGLSDTYRGGKEAFPGYFEPTEVDGYPAVFNDLTDGRPNGACNITVGISDTLAFRAAEQASKDRGAKSCDGAKQVAAAVIKTLKGA